LNLSELLSNDFLAFYTKFANIVRETDEECAFQCPIHDDSVASLHINIITGKWHCKACNIGGHDPISFYSRLFGIDTPDAIDELETLYGLTKSPISNVSDYHKKLLENAYECEDLIQSRKISLSVIKQFKIGWDGKRYYIPITDFGGNVRNIRKHLKIKTEGQEKTISEAKGVGAIRLFPLKNVKGKEIYIFEGELDTLCAISHGLNAITVTGGAGSWNKRFNKYFRNKSVVICYDVDDTGKEGAKKIASELFDIASDLSLIHLPENELPPKGDFGDYIKLKSIDEFLKLEKVKFTDISDISKKELVHEVHLSETFYSEYYNQPVQTTAIITGKGALFQVPKKIELRCKKMDKTNATCLACTLYHNQGYLIRRFVSNSSSLLRLFNVTEAEQTTLIKRQLGVPGKCPYPKLNVLEVFNIEETTLVPEIDFNSQNVKSHASRSSYLVGNAILDTNKPYILESLPLVEPKTQKSILLTYKHTSTKDNIDEFEMSPVLYEKLKVFQADSLQDMEKKLIEKFRDYTAITRIFDRNSLFMAVDLVYHSLLAFDFQDKYIKRSHVNALIFGDTRTGKTETVDALHRHFRAGDMAGGENVSFAGLVGGVHQSGNSNNWGISWKIIPLNDKRLVVIDEFHEMRDEDIKKMSEMMSSGIASIQKIHSEKTMARTRLLFLANCKNGQHLSHFRFGCEAIPALMGGHNEDIARLDFAFAVSNDDVDFEVINAKKSERLEVKTFTTELCHNLIMWAWSRKRKDVIFTPEAEKLIIHYANEQARMYHISIPLVPLAEQSLKLARLSAACAAQFFSTTDGVNVIVNENHVEMVNNFLTKVYASNAMGFKTYSETKIKKEAIIFTNDFNKLELTTLLADIMLSFDKLNLTSICEIFNVDKDFGRNILHVLLASNCITQVRVSGNIYIKTPAFIRYLSNLKKGVDKKVTSPF